MFSVGICYTRSSCMSCYSCSRPWEARQEEQVAVVGNIPTSWSREMVEAMVAILKVRDARLAVKGTFILATRHKRTDRYKMF